MAATAVDQRSCAMMTQCHREIRQTRSTKTDITSPEGDLRDVEADFQSLVNEMVQDSSKRTKQTEQAFSQIKSTSFSSTSSVNVPSPIASRKEAPSKAVAPPKMNVPQPKPGGQVVMAMPAKVIPEPDTDTSPEIVVERQMRVKDRIRKLEKQLSQESLESPQPPEVIMPRGRSGSIRTLADQFEQSEETTPRINTPTLKGEVSTEGKSVKEIVSTFSNQPESVTSQRKEEGLEFKNVKQVASAFQDPITPVTIKPPAPFSDDDAPEAVSPIPVLPPAMRKIPQKPPTPTSEAVAQTKPTVQRTLPFKTEIESYDHKTREYDSTDMKYSETTVQTSTESSSTSTETVIQQPIQYSAQVKCEVRSRVNTPDASDYQEQQRTQSSMGSTTKLNSTEIHSSSVKSSSSSVKSSSSASGGAKGSSHSTFGAIAPTPLARTSAKPPISDGVDSAMPRFSLLRSASTGSVGEALQSSMVKVKSEKDIPTFTVKKVKPVTTYGTKVWSPTGGSQDVSDGPSKIETANLPSFKDVPPVWTPARAGSASPSLGRKEYNKIKFEGATMPRKSQENIFAPKPEESFAWKSKEAEKLQAATLSSGTSLPRVQSPTVTLLQKRREGQIPEPRPSYLQNEESFYKPGDKLYTIKREYESEDEESGSRKFAVLGPKKFEGVGPTTRDGVPIALKSGVKSEHQGEWYRRMFDSLHKVKDARFSGYMSEPDGYDSDYGSRYVSLDRRNNKFEVDVSDAGPRNTKRYVHQPGRIENYVPGFSSLSEKELRDNPEADVKLEIKQEGPAQTTFQQRYGSGRRNLSHALKESGYESDSTLVFKKREDQRRKFLDPKYSSVVYRQVQQGGEIPLSGLQKPAPPKPKESPYKYSNSEVNIHYRTPVRFEQKEVLSEEELARRQEEHMKKVYEQERRKKYLAELEDIERRRHTDNFTPLQKSPIPLNRYDDETFGGPIGAKTPEPRQVAKALFNFTAQNKRELSFNKGDIVTIRRPIDRNWYEGELRGSVGIFPCNYVEVAPLDTLKSLGRKPSEGQARTRFNFQAQTAMEMSLTKGEIVILTRRVDENWYEGRIGNRRGIFPVSYVDVLREPGSDRPISPSRDPFPRPALPAAHLLYNGTSGMSSPYPSMGRSANQNETKPFTQLTVNTQQDPVPYRALYNYKPQNEDELELIEGDIVFVMEKCDDGWFVGTSKRTGLFGTFPGNYVESS